MIDWFILGVDLFAFAVVEYYRRTAVRLNLVAQERTAVGLEVILAVVIGWYVAALIVGR